MSKLDLNDFANGALSERVNIEMKKVLENIADPNTDAKKVRKITVTISLKADEQRDIAGVGIVTKSTLAPAKDIETRIILGYGNNGEVVGSELKSGVKGQTYIDADTGEIKDDKGQNIIEYQRREVK